MFVVGKSLEKRVMTVQQLQYEIKTMTVLFFFFVLIINESVHFCFFFLQINEIISRLFVSMYIYRISDPFLE